MQKIPLEDTFSDVIGKAQRGQKISDDDLAKRAGVSVADISKAKEGNLDENSLLLISQALNLHGPSVVSLAKKAWYPADHDLEGLEQFNTQFEDMTVNSYVVFDPKTREAALFDTGASATPMLDFIKKYSLKPVLILITHTHPDHIADLERVRKETGASSWVGEKEGFSAATSFAAGRIFGLGSLKIESRQTSGHARGGISYCIRGLSKPVAIVGDALFAQSMGGGAISYEEALETNRRNLFSLPDETIVCAGHGPLTTIAEQKRVNPFYPEFK
jgi:hydroxyacylglutathione hydrolase